MSSASDKNILATEDKKSGMGFLTVPVVIVGVAIVLVFLLSVIFRVSEIEVEGNSIYTDEEIIFASGIEVNESMLFIQKMKAAAYVTEKLSYVDTFQIKRAFPNRVIMTVTESTAIAYIPTQDGTWAIDRECKLLSRLEKGTDLSDLIEVTGITAISPSAGTTADFGSDLADPGSYLTTILGQIVALDLRDKITLIDFTNEGCPVLTYEDSISVRLGVNKDTEHKFQMLISAISKIDTSNVGTLDLSQDDGSAHVIYD